MRTIHIAGNRSGVGKTTLVEAALTALPGWGAIKLSTHDDARHGPPALVRDPAVLGREGTDTARMLSAGAAWVAWIRATPGTLADLVADAIEAASALPGVVVEGASWWRLRRDGPLIVIVEDDGAPSKPGASDLAAAADLVVVAGRADLSDPRDPGRARILERIVTWSRG